MAFANYTDLVASINDWLDRSDLTGAAPDMIALAESRMRRELSPLFAERSADLTSLATGIAAVPADFGTLDRVIYDGATLNQLGEVPAANLGTGTVPLAYTIEANAIRLWPAGAYDITILYHPVLSFLTVANPTTVLLDSHPDLYFHGAMLYAHGYVKDDPRAAQFKALWDEALEEAKRYFTRQVFSTSLKPQVANVP